MSAKWTVENQRNASATRWLERMGLSSEDNTDYLRAAFKAGARLEARRLKAKRTRKPRRKP